MNPWVVVPLLAAVAVAFVLLPVALAAWGHYRRPKQVDCPLAGRPATVLIGAPQAALAALVGAPPPLVRACSLWPRYLGCPQACLSLSETSPCEATERPIPRPG
jgi:hypothetical protein